MAADARRRPGYAASAHDLLGIVQELSDDIRTVVLVGHNPGLEDLVDTS